MKNVIFLIVLLTFYGCGAWQNADIKSPTGRYNFNAAEGWRNQFELDENGNPTTIEVEPEIAHYSDLLLFNRRFKMVYYKQGNDSIIDFVQKGRWYLEKYNDSLVVVLNFKGLKNHQRMSFSSNSKEGIFETLTVYPSRNLYQKCERVF